MHSSSVRTRLPLAVAVAVAATTGPAAAQACPAGPSTFWKNDILPDNPMGVLLFSVIPGLCENEAAASVFTIPPGTPTQRVTQVSVGFGSGGGAQGATALVNVEIYDGVTFNGNQAVLGPKVFDFETATGANLQVTSSALNTLDLSPYDVTVGDDPSQKFVVAFRMRFNPNGNCTSGFTSNFFTDASQPGIFGCDPNVTFPQKNLIDIIGEGWQDAFGATVGGIDLCPLFYSGNWAIRACTEDADDVVCQPDIGFGGPGTAMLSVCGDPLTALGTADILLENAPVGAPAFLFFGLFQNPFPILGGSLVPVPWEGVQAFPVDGNGEVLIPGVGSGAGPVNLFVQFLVSDGTQPMGFQFSNAVRMEFL